MFACFVILCYEINLNNYIQKINKCKCLHSISEAIQDDDDSRKYNKISN